MIPWEFAIISIPWISKLSENFFASWRLSGYCPGTGRLPCLFAYAESIDSKPNFLIRRVEIVSYPKRPSNSISPRNTRFELGFSKFSNSLIELPSGSPALTWLRIFLSVRIFGKGFDFCSHIVNIDEMIFWTDFELCKTTSSIGFEKSIEFNFSLIAESSKTVPSESIFCSKFSALMSKTTSVIP